MTKEDINDIIQLLDNHFESIGVEIRDNIQFTFDKNLYYGDYYNYYDKNLYDKRSWFDKEISIFDHLCFKYTLPFIPLSTGDPKKKLEDLNKISTFNLKTYNYLDQEFRVIQFEDHENKYFFMIEYKGIDENIKLKRFKNF
jgi:hypothetical protein